MSLGIGELSIILVIVLLLFGAGKLPNVMRDVGKGMRQFREGLKSDDEAPPKVEDKKEK